MRTLNLAVITVLILVSFGGLSGLVTRPAAAGCYTSPIWGPIPVYAEVVRTLYIYNPKSYLDGQAFTDKTEGAPCTTTHRLYVGGTFRSGAYYNQNVFWRLNLPSAMKVGSVYLGSDEWIAAGGVGYSYVVIGQFADKFRNPSVQSYIPSTLWGRTFSISMYVAWNTWDCSSPWAYCGGTQTYVLIG